MTIAITGATGQLGQLVLTALNTRLPVDQIVALARDPSRVQGVTARAFDYDAPETLVPALRGVDKLLLISGSEVGKREAQHAAVIEAAKTAGVKDIVYTSLLHADRSPLSLAAEHVATEALLAASGIPHTILRNGWYIENYLGALPAALEHGAFIGSVGAGRVSGAPRKDYAEAAAVVLTSEGHSGKVYELAGDDAFTLPQLAAEVAAQSGKPVAYQDLPEADYAKALTGFGLPEGLAAAIASWDVGAAQGALYDDSRTLSGLIGRPTTSLADTVKAAL
ncbi:SDR family oxidoreductase [Paracoccus shanxieyensis]|uniref:NAD(P)H-binding protein n=1 Tax=Paracoccus shanxieyensis TaxID=2675752 RepID=A0A6L6J0M8_9RHOB|nr:SDR family oxidoreductase [Paracoccus shanxieyensis]MTH65388.1 NAD(P)H-binding protein [Paracoccus shanxieyensis]MTH88533.1 NAD(P)H-binding protein [Paracoccus shanxieyensis]